MEQHLEHAVIHPVIRSHLTEGYETSYHEVAHPLQEFGVHQPPWEPKSVK